LSVGQLIGAAEALRDSKAKGDNYISLFWARRDEAQVQIIDQMVEKGIERHVAESRVPDAKASLAMTKRYLENHGLSAKIIVGSVRSIDQIETAFACGADIVTIPPKLIREWMYTKRGIESVDQFNEAYRSIKDKTTLI
jgi:transaldolase